MKQKYFIFASEFAAVIGRNPFNEQTGAIKSMVRRIKGEKEPEVETFERVLKPELQANLLQDVGKIDNSEKVNEKIEQVKKEIQEIKDVSESDKKEIIQHIEKKHKTEFGIVQEDNVRETYEKENNLQVKKDNKLRSRLLFEFNEIQIYLCGRCDGITEINGETFIVEIKNRMKKLFNCVKEYELIQVYAYMYLLNIPRAKLIERHLKNSRTHDIEFELEKWNEYIGDSEIFFEIFIREMQL
jgi:hypothetical protein